MKNRIFSRKGCLLLSLLVCLLLTVASVTLGVAAEAGEPVSTVTFRTDATGCAQSGVFAVTLYVEENSELIDFQLALRFDPTLVSVIGVEEAHADASAALRDDGTVHVSFTNVEDNLTERTDFVTVTLRLNDEVVANTTEPYDFLSLDPTYLTTDAEASTMEADQSFRPLTIEAEFGGLTVYPFGDVNQSGKVSINDVTVLRQYLVGMRELTDAQSSVSNVYMEGEGETADESGLSILDAALIQRSLSTDLDLDPRDLHTHIYEVSQTVETTCGADGYVEYSCTGCNESYREVLGTATKDHTMISGVCSVCGFLASDCTHEVFEKTITLTEDDGCHAATLRVEMCECRATAALLEADIACTLTQDESLTEEDDGQTFVESMTYTYVCNSCSLCRRERVCIGMQDDFVPVDYTEISYCLISREGEDVSYTTLFTYRVTE